MISVIILLVLGALLIVASGILAIVSAYASETDVVVVGAVGLVIGVLLVVFMSLELKTTKTYKVTTPDAVYEITLPSYDHVTIEEIILEHENITYEKIRQ
jgi:hypothetical protein